MTVLQDFVVCVPKDFDTGLAVVPCLPFVFLLHTGFPVDAAVDLDNESRLLVIEVRNVPDHDCLELPVGSGREHSVLRSFLQCLFQHRFSFRRLQS